MEVSKSQFAGNECRITEVTQGVEESADLAEGSWGRERSGGSGPTSGDASLEEESASRGGQHVTCHREK